MAAPSWVTDSNAAPSSGPSFLGNLVAAPDVDGTGVVNGAKATVEGLEKGLTNGLSEKFQQGLQNAHTRDSTSAYGDNPYLNEAVGEESAPNVMPNLASGTPEERAARAAANPLKAKVAAGVGHVVMNPVSSTADAIGVPDGPTIFPQNSIANPTYGGTLKGLGDIAATAPEMTLKALAGMRPALESLAGLTKPGAEAWIKDPELVTKLKDALENQKLSGAQDMAGDAVQNTVDQLKQRGMTRADVGSKMLQNSATATIPYATADLQTLADKGSVTAKKLLAQAQDQITQKAAENGVSVPELANAMPNIPASGSDIYALTQDAGKTFRESGGVHPLTGQMIPQDPNLGRIWSTSRNAMANLPGVGPNVDALMGRTAQEAGIQEKLAPKIAGDNPLQILNTSAPDQLARLDYLAKNGMPELQDTSNAWQAAKNLSSIDYGKGAAGINMPLHGVSPKAQFLSSALNSLTGGLPQKAALQALPFAEMGKTSPWMSLDSLVNPATAARIISDSQKDK